MAKIIKSSKGRGDAGAAAQFIADAVPDKGVMHRRVIVAKEEAAKVVAKANEVAERIRKDAEKVLEDAKRGHDEAIKKGFASGEAKGLSSVTEKLLALKELKENFYAGAEPEVIKLVMEIAEKVIGSLALKNDEMIRNIVHMALEKALGDRITVRVNPADHKNIMKEDSSLRDVLDRTKRLTFREDDSISKGGCIVETEVGTIDAQLETQLQAIRKALIT